MQGLCHHGVPPDYRCYDCEPERPQEKREKVEREQSLARSDARLARDRLRAGKPVAVFDRIAPDTVDRLLGLYGLKGDDLYRHAAYSIIQADEYLSMAEAWMRAALECKEWAWDEDQHESCSRLVADIQKRLRP